MMKRVQAALSVIAIASVVAPSTPATAQTAPEVLPTMPETVGLSQGAALYAQNCSTCHGAELGGQPNWRTPGADGILPAPPHDDTGHTWHHSDAVLYNYTALGGDEVMARMGVTFDSGMPGFADSLTPQEIWNILAYIRSTWPDRIQEIQAVRTEAEISARGDR
jgi:mono/diheme cytochrome c family protein